MGAAAPHFASRLRARPEPIGVRKRQVGEHMEETLWNTLIQQGPFAGLFVWLLFTTKKEAREREQRLQDILEKFSEKYDLVIERLDRMENQLRR
jgi:BhlA holin family